MIKLGRIVLLTVMLGCAPAVGQIGQLIINFDGNAIIVDGQLQVVPVPPTLSAELAATMLPVVGQGFASDKPVEGTLAPLVRSLRSDSYLEREKASEVMLRLPPERLPDVVAALAVETDLEAISRMKTIAGHLFLKPRTNVAARSGFLGIGALGQYVSMLGMKFYDPERMHVAETGQDMVVVRVRELLPGFPSAQELRAGDCIAAINGKPFPEEMVPARVRREVVEDIFADAADQQAANAANLMFQNRVRSLWPGGVATFTVVREGKLMEVPVQLAAMPASAKDSLGSLMDMRMQLMTTYIDSLKTAEKTQVRGNPGPRRQLTEGIYDWGTVQNFQLWGGEFVLPAARDVKRE